MGTRQGLEKESPQVDVGAGTSPCVQGQEGAWLDAAAAVGGTGWREAGWSPSPVCSPVRGGSGLAWPRRGSAGRPCFWRVGRGWSWGRKPSKGGGAQGGCTSGERYLSSGALGRLLFRLAPAVPGRPTRVRGASLLAAVPSRPARGFSRCPAWTEPEFRGAPPPASPPRQGEATARPQRRWEGGTHGTCGAARRAERTRGFAGSPGRPSWWDPIASPASTVICCTWYLQGDLSAGLQAAWLWLKRGERNLLGPRNTPLLGHSLRYSLASSVGNSLPVGVPQQTRGFSSSSLNFEHN
ncbi:uncharacterized protein LOC111551466 [Piliocolobus tephrosceles]|uniref:uncharacterized protein LOC111551466 n=1 Tax=Piliocolobus tephrosceles TaxID=591936 RepID=UPI000C29EAD3|nr:uncharacterized protein LOC111551466 [Piliocolobus tephrosceles]